MISVVPLLILISTIFLWFIPLNLTNGEDPLYTLDERIDSVFNGSIAQANFTNSLPLKNLDKVETLGKIIVTNVSDFEGNNSNYFELVNNLRKNAEPLDSIEANLETNAAIPANLTTVIDGLAFIAPNTNLLSSDDAISANSRFQLNYSDDAPDVPEDGVPTVVASRPTSPLPSPDSTLKTHSKIFGFHGANASFCEENCEPPDPVIAVGKEHIVEIVNELMAIYDKQGHLKMNTTLLDAFSLLSGGIHNPLTSDPNIVYDFMENRWFASFMVIDEKNPTPSNRAVLIAASKDSNPMGLWYSQTVRVDGENPSFKECVDRPMIGISDTKLFLSANLAHTNGSGFCREGEPDHYQILVGNKIDLLNSENKFRPFRMVGGVALSLVPVKSYGIGQGICLVSTSATPSGYIWLYSLNITNDKLTDSSNRFTLINQTYLPRGSLQPDTEKRIHTGDSRILDAAYHNGKIWAAYNTSCKTKVDEHARDCIRFIQLLTGNSSSSVNCNSNINMSRTFDFPIGGKNLYYYYPALEINDKGNVIAIFGYSNKSIYPSLGVVNLTETNDKSVIATKYTLRNGRTIADETRDLFCEYNVLRFECNRYGDYFSAARDPIDSSVVWVVGELYDAEKYSTYIAKIDTLRGDSN